MGGKKQAAEDAGGAPAFLNGGGEMGALMRAHDWSHSSLGHPSTWPQSLRTIVRLMLNTGHPMYVWWGEDGACLYNDAYRESIGPERHPGSLGRPAREVWDEIWPIIGPQIDQVMSGGGATWHVNQLVPITRHGRLDEVYWTYSYSPIDEETAPSGIGGVLVVCTETTQQVLAARELARERDRLAQLLTEREQGELLRREASEALRASEARYRELAEQLSDANRVKDEFLATLAHELRNPLAPMRTALELLNRAPDDSRVAASARDVLGRQLAQVVSLIDDLLDLSRVSRGIIDLRRKPLPLGVVLRDALDTSRPVIEHRGHTLSVTIPDEPLVLDADPTRIVQVFTNLLNNAAKYTPDGGRVEVMARRGGDAVAVAVRDSGVGIPADMLHRVFDMFAQVDRENTQSGGGLGIGLTLVRRLVDMHGGTVEARSGGPGMGSEFIVRLPLAASAPAEEKQRSGAAAGPPAPRRRIVVADDNADATASLSMMLELMGHETRTAHDGRKALEIARDFRPDAMVLDIAMPGLGGHEVARTIRQEDWGAGVLLIAASGWGQADDRQLSLDAGFDHHLVKPIDIDALEALLRERGGPAGPDAAS